MFCEQNHWFILNSYSNMKVVDVFNELDISINSEITLAEATDDDTENVVLYDIWYNNINISIL